MSSIFVRPSSPPKLVLTDRDLAVFAALSRHGYLTADHLALLCFHGSGARVVQRRLRALWANGYLERHFLQWVLTGEQDGRTAGRRPLYRLARPGRDALAAAGFEVHGASRAGPSSQLSVGHIEHDVVATDFLVRLEHDAGKRVVRVQREPALWAAQRKARVSSQVLGTRGLISDGASTLAGTIQELGFQLEVVRADVRGGLGTLSKRMLRYASLNRARYFARVHGQDVLRAVIFLTTSPERAANLQQLAGALPHSRRLFWFGHFTQVIRAGVPETDLLQANVLELPFKDGNGDPQSLARELGSTQRSHT